jgi:hypothetical protein
LLQRAAAAGASLDFFTFIKKSKGCFYKADIEYIRHVGYDIKHALDYTRLEYDARWAAQVQPLPNA